MADQKKWFKVWGSLIHDAKFQNIRMEDIGRWTVLLAIISDQGEKGKITIIPPAPTTLHILRCSNIEGLKSALKLLPNVQIGPPKNDNGDFTVSILKWFKYQVDYTAYERVLRSRYKKRREVDKKEIRREGEQTALPPLSFFVKSWKEKTAEEKQRSKAEIAEGLKAYRLGFRVEEEMFADIMGGLNGGTGTKSGKSFLEQVAERRAKERSQEKRDHTDEQKPGKILDRIRNMPTLPSET